MESTLDKKLMKFIIVFTLLGIAWGYGNSIVSYVFTSNDTEMTAEEKQKKKEQW